MTPPPVPSPRLVLLVEDNADARDALRALLELDGHAVEAVAEGAQAVAVARARRPAVAVIDLGLPGLDGYEVARRIRGLGEPVPVMIALTGYNRPEDRRRTRDAGFAAHLVKPVDPAGLSRLVASLGTPRPGSRG